MLNSVKKILNEYLGKHHPARRLFAELEQLGDVYLIGGVLREIKDYDCIKSLRDIDIILDTTQTDEYKKMLLKYNPGKNRFGGYKICCNELIVDVWLLEQTWAYSSGIIKCKRDEYAKMLPKTVFLNLDSIVYDLKNDKWYGDDYQKAMQTRILDVVLERNPFLELNIVRSFVLKERYSMQFSENLQNVIQDYTMENNGANSAALKLWKTQMARYKREILKKEEIEENLQRIMGII